MSNKKIIGLGLLFGAVAGFLAGAAGGTIMGSAYEVAVPDTASVGLADLPDYGFVFGGITGLGAGVVFGSMIGLIVAWKRFSIPLLVFAAAGCSVAGGCLGIWGANTFIQVGTNDPELQAFGLGLRPMWEIVGASIGTLTAACGALCVIWLLDRLARSH